MARVMRDAKLENRASRSKLELRKEPYWKSIGQGLHLGYYKGAKGCSWYVRYRNSEKKYIWEVLGLVDDVMDADGVKVFSFYDAQEQARDWFLKRSRIDAGLDTYKSAYTVNDALDDYLAWFTHERKSVDFTSTTIDTHIRPHLGNIEIAKLTPKQITEWRNKVASTPPRLRSSIGQPVKYKNVEDDNESDRRRKSTTNRIFTILKAALNHAYHEGKVSNDDVWRRVKPFHNVDSPTISYLKTEECKRLINVCDEDLRYIVKAALFTGCRYGEISRMRCADFHAESGTMLIKESKSGKPRRVVLSEEGRGFFHSITDGKPSDTILFLHDGKIWGKSHQSRRLGEACERANIKPAISFHILRHTHASQLAMHGVSMAIIAQQLGHSDTRTCERHYAHLCPNYVADTIRANLPSLGTEQKSNITQLKVGKVL